MCIAWRTRTPWMGGDKNKMGRMCDPLEFMLLAQFQTLNQRAVAVLVLALEVVQQFAATAH